MYPRFCPSGYHILSDVLGEGAYGTVNIATCDQNEYIVKLVTDLAVTEIINQNKAARIGISIPVVDVLYHNEKLGMVMERLDSTLSDELVLSDKQLQIAMPNCERYLLSINDFLQAYSNLESCKEMIDIVRTYLRDFSTFRKIEQFYNMFSMLKKHLTFIHHLTVDLYVTRELLLHGKPIELPLPKTPSENDVHKLDNMIDKYDAYWNLESCKKILKNWKNEYLNPDVLDKLKTIKMDIEQLKKIKIQQWRILQRKADFYTATTKTTTYFGQCQIGPSLSRRE